MRAQVYGIPNCGSVKKALEFFRQNGVEVDFHDFKKKGVPPELLEVWVQTLGLNAVLNKKGTTWRGLLPEQQALAEQPDEVMTLLLSNPSLIKRPVVYFNARWSVGQTTF